MVKSKQIESGNEAITDWRMICGCAHMAFCYSAIHDLCAPIKMDWQYYKPVTLFRGFSSFFAASCHIVLIQSNVALRFGAEQTKSHMARLCV
jgi:hypothetical protein